MKKFILIFLYCFIYPLLGYSQHDTLSLIFKLIEEKNVASLLMENEWSVKDEGNLSESKTIIFRKYIAYKDNDLIIVLDYRKNSNYIIYEPYSSEDYNFFLDIMRTSRFLEIESENYNERRFIKEDLMFIFRDDIIESFNTNEQQKRLEEINFEKKELTESISSTILFADSLSLLGEYEESIVRYNQIIQEIENIPEYFTYNIVPSNLKNEIINKISLIHQKQKDVNIKLSIEKGNLLFDEKIYNKSLETFNYVLSLDKYNKIAKKKISEIEKIQSILKDRRYRTFSYSVIEKNRYLNLKNNLSKKLEKSIDNSENGTINFSCLLSFDTLGVSELNISCNDNTLRDYISQLYKNLNPYPPKINNLHFSTKDTINIKLNWETDKVSFNFNSNSLVSNKNLNENDYIESYIRNIGFGKYKFKIKKKEINDTTYNDFSLSQYKVRGSSNALYSFVLPGLGTYRASYGEKGRNRYKSILFFSAAAYGSKLLSKSQYNKYQESTLQSEMDTYYENATTYNIVSQITWGIAGSIYIGDILTAFNIGKRNKKNSKILRQRLRKEGDIKIISNPITIK